MARETVRGAWYPLLKTAPLGPWWEPFFQQRREPGDAMYVVSVLLEAARPLQLTCTVLQGLQVATLQCAS